MNKVRQLAVLVSMLAVGIGVAGCGNTVSASDIAHEAQVKLNQHFAAQGTAQRVAKVSCPRDLNAKVGASEVCSAVGTPGNVKLNITATVASVSGSNAHIHFSATVASGAPSSAPSGTSTG